MALDVQVITRTSAAPSRGIPTDTGKTFVAVISERGPVGQAVSIKSLSEYQAAFGGRETRSPSYDWVETYFAEQGSELVVSRIVGPSPTNSNGLLVDTAGTPVTTLAVAAKDPGAWYDTNRKVQVVNNTTTYTIKVLDAANNVLETSPTLTTRADAVTWSASSAYINVTLSGASVLLPKAQTVSLTGGNDAAGSATSTQKDAALAVFGESLGAGQVVAPGDSTYHQALLTHAATYSRFAVLDGAVDDTATALIAKGTTAQGLTNPDYGMVVGPWVQVVSAGVVRTVPASAVMAALMSRADETGNPGTPAAGRDFPLRTVKGLAINLTDANYDALNEAGVSSVKNDQGSYIFYGFRSLAKQVNESVYWQAHRSRLRNAIVANYLDIAKNFQHRVIDGRRTLLSDFQGALVGYLTELYEAGALYGLTQSDAFRVDVASVNTDTTINNGELHAVVSIRPSAFAEFVQIELISKPLTQTV